MCGRNQVKGTSLKKRLLDFWVFYVIWCTKKETYYGIHPVGRPIDTPMFEGDSYMSLPGIEGAVLQLRFSIRFLALKSGNMLLLYNGQTIFPGRGDFISLAIHEGRVEFRFNMGSGTGILRSASNISVGFWHTVIIERQLRDSLLVLDDDPPVKGSSPCCSRGLNLLLDSVSYTHLTLPTIYSV